MKRVRVRWILYPVAIVGNYHLQYRVGHYGGKMVEYIHLIFSSNRRI